MERNNDDREEKRATIYVNILFFVHIEICDEREKEAEVEKKS